MCIGPAGEYLMKSASIQTSDVDDHPCRAAGRGGLGAVIVIKQGNTLSGIITDGDIRRTIAKKRPVHELKAEDVMTKNPQTAGPDSPAYDALYLMEQFQITVLPITDSGNKILGVLHLHDILGKGSFSFNGQ